MKKGIIISLMFLLPFSLTIQSCDDETIPDLINSLLEILNQTGWLQEQEQMDNIPEDITPFDDNTNNLASSVSLESKFPPIGDQGSYGTCVAWSVGYNLKTALNAIENGWTSTQLASTSNQTSPKDLWLVIPSSQKGTKCEGTNFEPALDALISDGAATLGSVPYNMGSCTGTKTGNSSNKLANYRKIASETEGLTVDNFKGYLNAGRPIAIGAKLGDRFMTWNSSAVISSDTYNNPGMQHAYHAMVLVGYDDAKNAFRVRNSWGSLWGDKGSIWVDYNFFCRSFCFAAFVAQNVNNVSFGNNGEVTDLSKGADLLAYYAEDYDYIPGEDDGDNDYTRTFYYEVYNSGTTTIRPSQKWTVTYMYYNAKNAKDYEIIYDDYYTNEFGQEGDIEYNPNSTSLLGGYLNNITVAPGQNAGEGYEISYKMPQITGSYYLVVMADAYDVIKEVNEDNNFYFITADNGKPLEFRNGVITNISKSSIKRSSAEKRPALFSNTDRQTPVVPGNLNTYTPTELKKMLIHDKKNGQLEAKRKAFSAESTGKNHVKRVRK